MAIAGIREAFGVPTLPAWRRFFARLTLAANEHNICGRKVLDDIFKQSACAIRTNELVAVLVSLGVLKDVSNGYEIQLARAELVTSALQMLDQEPAGEPDSWQVVATLPADVDRNSLPADISVTKACVFGLIEEARSELWLATPFMDNDAVSFVSDSLVAKISRGVVVKVLTARCNAEFMDSFVQKLVKSSGAHNLFIWEASTYSSKLGLHAKAIVSDAKAAYLGSANLTSYGLDKHFELGVRLDGPRVSDISRILERIAESGTLRFGGSIS